MMLNNFKKIVIVVFCALLINTFNFNSSYSDDHTPKRKLINELKEEITELGGKPVKKKHLFFRKN